MSIEPIPTPPTIPSDDSTTHHRSGWYRSQRLDIVNGSLSIQHAKEGGWMKLRVFPKYENAQRAVAILNASEVESLLDLIMQYTHGENIVQDA